MPITFQKVHARQILNSRGMPTVEAELKSSNGLVGDVSSDFWQLKSSREQFCTKLGAPFSFL